MGLTAYFICEAYEKLLRTAEKEDLEVIYDATKDCLRYVQTVCNGENLLNTADETDRDMVGEYDAIRHNAHEDAITSAAVLNRLADRQGIAPLYTGDITDRHQVSDFCLEMTAWLFQNRRRVL